jgi:hypothetical protein
MIDMDSTRFSQPNNAFTALRQIARARPKAERCEMCGAVVGETHQHLIEPAARKLVCACDGCAVLFSNSNGKYRRVPRSIRYLPDFTLTDGQWDSLMIPINMAFFFHSTPAGRVVAIYPSPAGPTESLLTLESWKEIELDNPILKTLAPDVEALLVSRNRMPSGEHKSEYWLVPIDECYKLTGLIRGHWRGLSGGATVWNEIGRFFLSLKERAQTVGKAADD